MTEERYRHKKRGSTYTVIACETFEVPEGYEAVRDADGRATGEVRKVDPTTTAKVMGGLWDQLIVLSGYYITQPPTPDHEFVQVCSGDLRKMVELMNTSVQAPAPQMTNVVPSESPWQWWAGEGEEWLTVGPEDTREAIISAATNDRLGEFQHDGGGWNLSFYIVEARKDPLRLADWIHDCDILDHAEDCLADSDRVASEFDEGPWFTCSAAQKKDLQERINRACDEWQAAHGLVFSCTTFSHTRNEERIIVELHDDRNATEVSDNVR